MLRITYTIQAIYICSALVLGCDDPTESIITDVEAELSAHIQTVIRVNWQTTKESVGYVEYGPTEEFGHSTPVETTPALSHEVLLLGMTPSTEVFYRVVIWNAEDIAGETSETASIQTGFLPTGIPALSGGGEGNDQYIIVPVMGSAGSINIINPEGQIVWSYVDGREFEFFRAWLSRDGEAILYNAASVSGDPAVDSEIVRVSLDGSEVTAIPVPLLAHDFLEMEDGTLAAITTKYGKYNSQELAGNAIVEIDPETGDQTEIWNSWDCFDPAQTEHDNMWTQGWTFCNALDYYPGEDAYYIGSLEFSSIIKVDRKTGTCPIVIGGPESNVTFTSGYPFMGQHQFQNKGTSLLVFDNGPNISGNSRAVKYDFNQKTLELSQTWQFDAGLYTFVLGDVTELPGGNTFITWSASGQMNVVTNGGESIWQLNTNMGFIFGFHDLHTSLYVTDAS